MAVRSARHAAFDWLFKQTFGERIIGGFRAAGYCRPSGRLFFSSTASVWVATIRLSAYSNQLLYCSETSFLLLRTLFFLVINFLRVWKGSQLIAHRHFPLWA
ncbi:unnamed protein product [Gongylonema pulchrum]|uniref:Uncharacterized protein n=1 Tax=Gongylonema pulchrum TaxID=637853 RepID=A0A183E8U3_9BILA|nr:unnamed protein product [Gongylonema pulchrum]